MDTNNRTNQIIITSNVGIALNILLATAKAIIGLMSNSIAIVSDAVNNLTDAISSVVTLITAFLSNKPADKDHPYGHGRAEYVGSVIISLVILYIGISTLVEAIKKIITPEVATYDVKTFVIVILSLVIKFAMSVYFIKVGKKVNSQNLVASGEDARFDSVISLSTLICAVVFIFTNINLEAYLAFVISLVIIKAGVSLIKSTFSIIEGERIDANLSKAIKESIKEFDKVKGVFDLTLNNYGTDKLLGSVHVEVDHAMTADEIDDLSREIQDKIKKEFSIILTAVGIYAIDLNDKSINDMHHELLRIISQYDDILQIHGFSVNKIDKHMHFDMVVKFGSESDKLRREVIQKMNEIYKDYEINIAIDIDVSDCDNISNVK